MYNMNKMSSNVADSFQVNAHAGQTRWDGQTPYHVHPRKVVSILKQFGVRDDDVLSAGYLHDVLEDTKVSEKELELNFGNYVLSLVKELTFKDSSKDDKVYYDQVKALSNNAKLIKIADIIANLTDDGRKSQHFITKRLTALTLLVDPLFAKESA